MPEVKVQLRDFGSSTGFNDDIIGELDITSSEDFPLSLTFKSFDVRDFNSRGGSFSKSFRIPATNNNNRILNNVWKSGFIKSSKNVARNIKSTILVDNVPIIDGKLRISKIYRSVDVEGYECTFVGDNMDWASDLKNREMKDLQFSDSQYNTYPPNPIVTHIFDSPHGIEVDSNPPFTPISFANKPTTHSDYEFNNDKFVYPLLSMGEGISPKSQVTEAEFVPCLYVKNIWDKIFQSSGYTVNSTFCDSEFFKSLVMPLNFERNGEQVNERYGKIKRATDEEVLDGFNHDGNRTFNRAIGNPTINQNLQDGAGQYLHFAFRGDQTSDNFNGGDTSASTGNVQGGTAFDTSLLVKNYNGNMTLHWDVTINAFNPTAFSVGGEPTLDFSLKFFIVRVSDDDDLANLTDAADGQGAVLEQVATQNDYIVAFNEGAANSNNVDLPFNGSVDISNDPVGTKYMLFCRFQLSDYAGTSFFGSGDDAGSVSLVYKTGSKFEIQGGNTFNVGEAIDQPQYLLPKGSQSDFLMGIAQMFNLQFSTDAAAKVVDIEPYDHFYNLSSNAYDWSDKIDYSKGIEEEFIYDIKSKLVFKYKNASNDAFLERYDKKNDVLWGSYKEIDETQSFFDGEYKVENKFFSPTFNWHEIDYIDKSASGTSFTNDKAPCIPIYHKEFSKLGTPDERAEKSFDIGARILLLAPSSAMLSTDNGYQTRYSYAPLPDQDLSATSLSNSSFARANFIHIDNLRSSGSRGVLNNGYEDVDLNLSYSDVKFNSTENNGGEVTMNGLYYYYYNKMVKQLKERPRLKIMYVNLSLSDISSLDLRKLVFVDGAYYRINKVIDYQPHKNVSTKVELTEYFELGRDTSQLGQTPILENIRL
jgi:hypothetical protein